MSQSEQELHIAALGTALEAAEAYAKHMAEQHNEYAEGSKAAKAATDAKEQPLKKRSGGYDLFHNPKNPTGYMGVSLKADGKFYCQYQRGGGKYLGAFDSAVEAAVAYA